MFFFIYTGKSVTLTDRALSVILSLLEYLPYELYQLEKHLASHAKRFSTYRTVLLEYKGICCHVIISHYRPATHRKLSYARITIASITS